MIRVSRYTGNTGVGARCAEMKPFFEKVAPAISFLKSKLDRGVFFFLFEEFDIGEQKLSCAVSRLFHRLR